jgi:hypothetical protein
VTLLLALIVLSILFFPIYGSLCLTNPAMRVEFERYGLGRFRRVVGVLDLFAGVGLLVGLLRWTPALWISSGGLFLMMLGAVGVRIKIRDGVVKSLPAIVLMLTNLYILVASVRLGHG